MIYYNDNDHSYDYKYTTDHLVANVLIIKENNKIHITVWYYNVDSWFLTIYDLFYFLSLVKLCVGIYTKHDSMSKDIAT